MALWKKMASSDSNWRLNNGNMVILDNLKKYWIYYINSKYFPWIKLKLKNKKKINLYSILVRRN